MVVQKTLNNLKERPKDERKAVASSIAVGVIIILFLAWAVLFFHRIQSGAQTPVQNPAVVAPVQQTTQTNTYDSYNQTQQGTQVQTNASTSVQ